MPSSTFVGPRLRRRLLSAAAALMCVAFLWVFTSVNLFRFPHPERLPESADAVVVLAGAAEERLDVGRQLWWEGRAPVLVLSTTDTPGNRRTDVLCGHGTNPRVLCFSPDPMTTRGEARAVARLAAENGWDELIVVTSRYHVVRAQANLEQCSGAEITMAASEPELGPGQWLSRFVEESAGTAAALLRPACANAV